MNWRELIRFGAPDNELLPTTYSPTRRCEQFVNNANHSTTPAISRVKPRDYSQRRTVGCGGGEQLFGLVPPRAEAPKPVRAPGAKQKTTHCGWPALVEKKLSGRRFGFGLSFSPGFGFGACLLALQVGIPPFPFLTLIVLFAHNSLHSDRIAIV